MNRFLIKIIHLWCYFKCCDKLKGLIWKWIRFFNWFILKIIHLWCDYESYDELKKFISKLNSIFQWIYHKNNSFIMEFSLFYDELKRFVWKWIRFFNRFLVKIIHLWCYVECCEKVKRLILKSILFFNGFLVRIIHLWCYLEYYDELKTTYLKMNSVFEWISTKNSSFEMWSLMLW